MLMHLSLEVLPPLFRQEMFQMDKKTFFLRNFTSAFHANLIYANDNIWAVLVSGSNGWYNYRHQADICHAYKVLLEHGVPEKHIIVMSYDDIAKNEYNPLQGKVFNHIQGPEVCSGIKIDYKEDDVTPENLLRLTW
ncbi:Legumain [Trichinella spiralis]|uniref:Legumain n=1 Tax=Trichinella spiralis TaxID=6334 RepID=A0ABR3L0H9_TRISP